MKRPEIVTEVYYKISDIAPVFKTGNEKTLLLDYLELVFLKGSSAGFREAADDMTKRLLKKGGKV